ncbi:zinc-binding alcohol dehydrogenase family protein [Aquipseudomonas alcaligenes]|uniref:quinone oxidoreductase family protein n=1 Tax=Aquipseudomonas alcaligenes TaxID=43263 RepID=UPI0037490ACF
MHALQFSSTGDLAALRHVELARPQPDDGEVLVEVRAAGLNPSDVKNVLGRFPYTTLPRVPGRDFAGVVVEGPAHLLGKAVWGTGKGLGFSRDGSHAQYICLPAEGVALKPDVLSFSQAAALGVPYTTAWDGLVRSQVGAGTRLLVIGANGAVGTAALGLAKALGAEVLAAVRNVQEQQRLLDSGIACLLLGSAEQLATQVEAVFPGGAEVIFDTTGFWLPAAVSALANFGRIAYIAAPLDGMVNLPALNLYRRGGTLVGVNTLLYTPTDCARMLEQFGTLFTQGLLTPPTAFKELPLSAGPEAYAAVNTPGSCEKIILLP